MFSAVVLTVWLNPAAFDGFRQSVAEARCTTTESKTVIPREKAADDTPLKRLLSRLS
jgi:hypothetical protein